MKELSRLPGIGPRSAQRLAFHLLKESPQRNQILGEAISGVHDNVHRCEQCFCLADSTECKICANPLRDQKQLCVVESTLDLIAIEKTGSYKGLYHILQGRLSPLDGIGPQDIRVAELLDRLSDPTAQVEEVILALNPDLEGDTTALFLNKKISSFARFNVCRIARGIPSGGHLEYTDDATLTRALQGRQAMV